MTALDKPPYVQACQMIECHQDYDAAIELVDANIKMYSNTYAKWPAHHSQWWKEVKKELIKLKRNHNLTDHEYYMEITGELDDPTQAQTME